MSKTKQPTWRLEIRKKRGAEFPFIAYAVHSSGKFRDREGRYGNLGKAISAGSDLVMMLNAYHPNPGPRCCGQDAREKAEGRVVSPKRVAKIDQMQKDALLAFMVAHDEIFKTKMAPQFARAHGMKKRM